MDAFLVELPPILDWQVLCENKQVLTMGCCSRTVLSRSPCSQNSAATERAT